MGSPRRGVWCVVPRWPRQRHDRCGCTVDTIRVCDISQRRSVDRQRYVLSFGGLLLFAGRLADAIGRRVVLLVGVAILLAGSLLGTFATTVELIIVARFGMGVGAALTAPAGLAIITTTFPEGPARNRAVGIYTACGAVGFSAGLLGGGLLSSVGWRWVFALSVVMAAVVWAGAVTFVPP